MRQGIPAGCPAFVLVGLEKGMECIRESEEARDNTKALRWSVRAEVVPKGDS
jgi:hypothetical protein